MQTPSDEGRSEKGEVRGGEWAARTELPRRSVFGNYAPSPPASARQAGLQAASQRSEDGRTPQFLQGDAQRVPFPDRSFEIVTIGYGLRNLASWETGLGEMIRVAKPGGRLLVLEFGKPDNPLWRAIYFAYLKWFVPVFGRVFCNNAPAYAYILESLRHYPAQHGVAAKMRALGLRDVRVFNLAGGAMSIHYAEKPSAT